MLIKTYYEENAVLINASDGRYTLKDIKEMIPYEFNIYLINYKNYLDKLDKE